MPLILNNIIYEVRLWEEKARVGATELFIIFTLSFHFIISQHYLFYKWPVILIANTA